jgi:hypothetical protein
MAGAQEPQEAHALEPAGLVDAQEHQVITNSLLSIGWAKNLTSGDETLDRILGIVVVPRNSVVIEEREQTGPIFLDSFLIRLRRLRLVIRRIYQAEKSLDVLLMFPQMATLEPELVDRINDRP